MGWNGWDWGQAGQGAAGGAMAGGSVAGPWGALVGGVVGGAAGGFGGPQGRPQKTAQERLLELQKLLSQRGAPGMGAAAQMGQVAQGSASPLMGNRMGLVAQLEAMARGDGPSAAKLQMEDAMDRAISSQTSLAAGAGGRGVNAGASMRSAQNNVAALQAQGARDTATLRAQEQMNAVGQLGGVIGQGMATDNQLSQFNAAQRNTAAQFNAEQQNAAQQANLRAILETMGLNDSGQLQALMAILQQQQRPGFGSQILAGGATAMPSLLQYRQSQQQKASQSSGGQPLGWGYGATQDNGLIEPEW